MSLEPQLQIGLTHHRAGRLREAEEAYRQILAAVPNHADAMHLLGLIQVHNKRHDLGIELIRKAISLNPSAADYHDNLGQVYFELQRIDDAMAYYRRAAELNPRHHRAHFNLGNMLYNKDRLTEAAAEYQLAAAITPGMAEAHQNLATTLQRLGRLDEAEASVKKALEINPKSAEARNTLGVLLSNRNRLEAAIAEYRIALAAKPDFAPALSNIGAALQMLGRNDEAISALRKSLSLLPNSPEALNNLGIALKDTGQLDESIKVFERCVALRPTSRDGLNNLGNAHKDCGNIAEAVSYYARALVVGPADPRIHSNLVYTLQFHPGYDDESLYREQRRWNEVHALPLAASIKSHENNRSIERKLRIGYVSAYFYLQAEAFFVVPLLVNHDAGQFEIHCYSSVLKEDRETQRHKSTNVIWHNVVSLDDQQLSEQIRQDGIDVLVDLSMHMARNRLLVFARKPAPVQITWLAYPGGTGLDAMDYRTTDGHMDPTEKETPYYREESIRLADCWVCFDPLINLPPAAPRESGPVRFGSINNPCKNNEPLVKLWARVMEGVPESTMLMLASGEGHRNRIRGMFQRAGISPARV
ncbi:MAG TPA: tetratricopeptide repeat protein, partial [Tepidisphaeraceae bacterium]